VLVANVSWRRLLVAIGLALFASAASAGAASAAPPKEGAVVPDQYIVVFKPAKVDAPAKLAQKLTQEHGGRLKHTYRHALEGYSARLSDQAVKQLRSDPAVKSIEPDRIIKVTDTQTDATWGLDRIDQRSRPLDRSYTDGNEGRGVHAYVFDTGISPHTEFAGRLGKGYDFAGVGLQTADCNGHGTHVAGTLGGASYGVADQVVLHPVRVADCAGNSNSSTLLDGIDWVLSNRVKPAVANISMGVDGGTSSADDTAVANLIKAGVTVAVAAGNDNVDACTRSPARLPAAITVGATNTYDVRWRSSNYGTCLDLFAPGQDITSVSIGTSVNFARSGTSMASPHAAGVAALYLSAYPWATPGEVRSAIVSGATKNLVTQPGAGSPNTLLYNNVAEMPPTPRPPPCERTRPPTC
jgi:subtilisin family serine protease